MFEIKIKNKRRIQIGKLGEEIAASLLIKNGYQVAERNWRSKLGEIDIIASQRDELIFVEVKTRSSLKFGGGICAVNPSKQKKIHRLALLYMIHKGLDINRQPIRFDIIAILLDKNRELVDTTHLKGVF